MICKSSGNRPEDRLLGRHLGEEAGGHADQRVDTASEAVGCDGSFHEAPDALDGNLTSYPQSWNMAIWGTL